MAATDKEIIIGAGDLYLQEFTGSTIPEDATIETDTNKVAHCSGGFSVEYKPEKYEVKNQYGKTVKSFIKSEEITAKTGLLTWNLKQLDMLSIAEVTEPTTQDKERKIVFKGNGGSLKNILIRFVHTKDDGKKLRFTMIGQGGTGFTLEFGEEETTVDAEFTAVGVIDNFLASFEEEVEVS